MMNQEIQDDEVTIDLMELFSALWAKKTIIILSAVFMALVSGEVEIEGNIYRFDVNGVLK